MFFKTAYIERVEDNQVLSGAADWQSVKPTDDVYYECTMQILETLTQISRPKEALRINIICWLVGWLACYSIRFCQRRINCNRTGFLGQATIRHQEVEIHSLNHTSTPAIVS